MLKVGDPAPGFKLAAVDGERYGLESFPTVAIFFKTSCPTCQYAWPYYHRLFEAYHPAGLQVYGISQHGPVQTREYGRKYGADFPQLVDEGLRVSRAFDPPFVPTLYLIDPSGKIAETLVSWSSEEFDRLSERIAALLHVTPSPIFRANEQVIAFKPG
jgi:peroxiredoxin